MSDETKRTIATVTKYGPASEGLLAATLKVDADVSAAYTKPGQYIVLHPEGEEKPVFMALASAPGAAEFELLIGSPAAEKLNLSEGKEIAIDPPGGNGYPVDLAEGKDVVLFGVGSGLSAMRSLVEYIRAHRADFKDVTAYFGARTEEAHAYKALDAQWAADGVTIHRTTSKPWVQDVFRNDPVAVDNAVAFVCGMKEMVNGVTEALVEAGLSKDLVRQNY